MNTALNSLSEAGIVFLVIALICILLLMIFYYSPIKSDKIKNFMNPQLPYQTKFFPPIGWFGIIIGIFVISGIICMGIGIGTSPSLSGNIDRNNTTVTNKTITNNFSNVENFGNNTTTTYQAIGYGPVIDNIKVKNWLNGNSGQSVNGMTSNQTAWPDGNGNLIKIPKEQFKALYGFIPPSFVYYPKGQGKNDYNAENYKSGRENCMQACTMSNCIAVQTEVPENCTQEQSSSTVVSNSCGNNSEFSCTLFFDNVKDADDGYWTINNFSSGSGIANSKGCFETTGSSCLGKKYYEDSTVPNDLPISTSKPSESAVTFCDSSITKTNSSGYGIVSGSCSCNGPVGGDNCIDKNCCVMRPLITTESVQHSHPYYSLPINVSKAIGAVSGNYSMVVPSIDYKNGSTSSCGIISNPDGSNNLVSCTGSTACSSASDTADCWQVDTKSCTGNTFDVSTGQTALNTYKTNYAANEGKNYDDLYPACYYRQKLTVVEPIQFNCDPSLVTIGCFGSPNILYTESLTSSGGFSACSNTSIIPDSQRCQNSSDIASCTGFPYSCGTSNGTNSLWVKQ
jgi:hypothetical protein